MEMVEANLTQSSGIAGGTSHSNESSISVSDNSKTSKKSGKLSKKCKGTVLRRILKKLHLQKKQFKRIDKIFVAEKQEIENEEAVDPYLVKQPMYQEEQFHD